MLRALNDKDKAANFARKSAVTGKWWPRTGAVCALTYTLTGWLPMRILSEIKGSNFHSIKTNYVDPGQRQVIAGVTIEVRPGAGITADDVLRAQPFRFSTYCYHNRAGLNRQRREVERRGGHRMPLEERLSRKRAATRRMVEVGKRQTMHEVTLMVCVMR